MTENNTLFSRRLILRPITKDDAAAIFAYRRLPEVAKYQYWEPFSLEQAADFAAKNANASLDIRNRWIGLAVILKENNIIIGDCALKIEDNAAEIGFNIAPKYQKQGFAKEVTLRLTEYVFNKANITQVFAITDTQNTASIKLLESGGFKRDLNFEERLICKGLLSIEHKYIKHK